MCGIAGFVRRVGSAEKSEIEEMCDTMTRRGPDDSGYFLDGPIALGHRRLSVIDLTTGHQPMFNDSKDVAIVFNGEIYNFQRLKSELIEQGFQFKTSSDTEVIINGYKAYGIEGILHRLEGMFAFALYDLAARKLFVARDRFGEKPLFYRASVSGFYFASEMKALTRKVAKDDIDFFAVNLFLSLSYIPAPFTIFKDVRKLSPGEVLTVELNGDFQPKRYYSLADTVRAQSPYTNYEHAKSDLRETLLSSVRDRMVADVPIGAFLSGGIDSSIIAAVMAKLSDQPIHTFSIGFKERSYNESERAALVANHIGSNHHLHVVQPDELLQVMNEVIDYFDEPFGDSSAIPLFILSRMARKHATVVLTGDCADELFAGYEKYLAGHYVEKFRRFPELLQIGVRKLVGRIPHSSSTNHLLRKFKKVLNHAELPEFDLHYALMCLGVSDSHRKDLLLSEYFLDIKPFIREHYDRLDERKKMSREFFTDVQLVLEGDMLPKADRMCMINSLEARLPYLHSNIVANSFRMPLSFKLKGRNKKIILKETFADLLPPEVFRFSKKGFGLPLALWFRNELREVLQKTLDPKGLEVQGIFNPDNINLTMEEHFTGKENHSSRLWCLFVFQRWYMKTFSDRS